jgi:hypothetical protein
MTHSQATLEEIGTEVRTPTFLAEVERLATAIDDYIIPSLRMEIHTESWLPANLRDEIPDFAVQGNISKEIVAEVVSRYLSETVSVVESMTNVKSDRFDYILNPVEKNVSVFPHTADCWRERHYSKKSDVDRRVERIHRKLEDIAEQEAASLNAHFGLNGFPKLSLNGTLAHSLAEYRQSLYQRTGVQGEEPVLLYQLCFQTLAKAKGWDQLEDQELIKVLNIEGIPVKEFTSLTEREVKLPERDESKTGIYAVDNVNVMSNRNPAVGGAVISDVPKQYHFISAGNYFAALEQLRRDCATDSNSLQPITVIAGQNYVRPPTVKEIMQWRLEDYNTLTNLAGSPRTEERKQLLNQWFFTCGGIAYSTDGRFKLSKETPQLITMNSVPTQAYLPVDYLVLNQNNNWQEFDRNQVGVKYSIPLTEDEVVAHPVWRYLAEDDSTLLRETHQLNCSLYNCSTVMSFWLLNTPKQDQLRALALSSFNNNSYLDGNYDLDGSSSFLRVARRSS